MVQVTLPVNNRVWHQIEKFFGWYDIDNEAQSLNGIHAELSDQAARIRMLRDIARVRGLSNINTANNTDSQLQPNPQPTLNTSLPQRESVRADNNTVP